MIHNKEYDQVQIIGIIALVAFFAILVSSCNEKPSNAGGPAAASCSGWTVQYSRNISTCIVDQFNFGEPHYLVKRPPGPLYSKTITLRYAVTGTGTLHPTDGGSPEARVRLYIQRSGDRLTADEPNKRWWSRDVILVVGQEGTLTQRVISEGGYWTQVFGQSSEKFAISFVDAVNNAQNVGFTFGGDFAGHGVVAKDGPVTFRVVGWEIK